MHWRIWFNEILLNNVDDNAFVVPRNGTITSVAAFFSNRATVNVPNNVTATIRAQLWKSKNDDPKENTFVPIPGTLVLLAPNLAGLVPSDSSFSVVGTPLSEAVLAGVRLIMVFTVVAPGDSGALAINGVASAGITFE